MIEKGIYSGVSWNDYRAIDLPSPSLLKHGLRSMLRLKRAIDGDVPPPAASVTAVGTAVHCMIADEFTERFAVMPEFEKSPQNLTAGKTQKRPANMLKKDGTLSAAGAKWESLRKSEGLGPGATEVVTGQEQTESKLTAFYKSSKEEFESSIGDKDLLSTVQYNVARKCFDQIMACKDAAELINDTNAKKSSEVVVIGEIGGLMVKTRMDGFLPSHGWDLKTTSDIEPRMFYRKFKQMNYGFQFACHYELLKSNGVLINRYSVIAAEVQDDFDVGVIEVPLPLLDVCLATAVKVCERFRQCKETGDWPGLYPEPAGLMVPDYDMSDESELEW